MTKNFIPVILAGGKGERFWPLSRRKRPKQFLCLDGSARSLLQATADRLLPLTGDWNKIWVITSASIAEGVKAQLPQLNKDNILIEPEGKDTAPAVTWTSLEIAKKYGDETTIAFFPADHWIGSLSWFEDIIKAAIELANHKAAIVTLGIKPNYPGTGYGYIERGDYIKEFNSIKAYKVARFTEKPDRATAESFIGMGKYSWNSGMFIFRAKVLLEELESFAPQLLASLKEKGKSAYSELEKNSIDYTLMEKTQLAYVIPADFGWDDLGDWNALERLQKEKQVNVELANHVSKDTKGAIIYSSDENEIIVTIGLEDVVIVRDRNATLIVKKNRTQEIKQILKYLKTDPNSERYL